jgi:membrane-associated protease RseP (regulator of RpoE activity)
MSNWIPQTRRLFGITMVACTLVLLMSETASAQYRRGRAVRAGVGVGYGPAYGYGGAYGYRGYGYSGYGYPSYADYSYASPMYAGGMGYTGSSYYTYPAQATYGVTQAGYSAAGAPAAGCCDPCGSGVAAAPGTTSTSGYMPAGSETGLRVVEVNQQSPAQTAGIVTGSVIESVDGQKVRTFDQLQTAFRNGKDKNVKVTLIDPNGQRRTHDVAVKDSKIGVSVVETPVNFQQPNRPDGTLPQPLPDRITPDSSRPDTTRPDSTRPDTIRPGTTQPGTTIPSTTPPSSTIPGSTQPGTTIPDRTTPKPVDPLRPRD